jgi:UDP-GlcNAc:undecaprenyl-phosphate GlcNAc-1-phosphate transferase
MVFLFTALFSSFLSISLIIRYQCLHKYLSGEHHLSGPQKLHQGSIPRIGGLGIYASLWITYFVTYLKDPSLAVFFGLILIASVPISIIGFTEDLIKSISVKARLFIAFISGAIFLYLFTITSIRISVWGLDALFLNVWVATIFLSFSIAGLTNAYNIIDGLNGLASMVGSITLAAIAFVAFKVGDPVIAYLAIIQIGAVLGFFFWNYPKGLIFLGDGGAYLIGFMVAVITILLVYRNPMISPWFALVVNAYPVMETLYTIWRRMVYFRANPGLPDSAHFHSLIYRRSMLKANAMNQQSVNSKTSRYLWLFTCIGTFPALLFWQSTSLLITSFFLFAAIYIYSYHIALQLKRF